MFYALFSTLILNRKFGIATLSIWLCLILANLHYTRFGDWSIHNTALSAINLSFFLGMGAYAISRRLSREMGLLALGAGIALLSTVWWIEYKTAPSDPISFGYNLALALIILGLVTSETQGSRILNPALSLIGNASYSLYLTHENFELALLRIFSKFHLFQKLGHTTCFAIIITTTVISGIGIHLTIEQPILKRLRALLVRKPPYITHPSIKHEQSIKNN